MIRRPLTFLHTSSPPLTISRRRSTQLVVNAPPSLRPFKSHPFCSSRVFFSSLWSSSGFCPLRGGREQVRLHRPGLPDDPPASQPLRGHPQGQRAPLDLPKQRLLEAAANSGREAAGGLLSDFPTACFQIITIIIIIQSIFFFRNQHLGVIRAELERLSSTLFDIDSFIKSRRACNQRSLRRNQLQDQILSDLFHTDAISQRRGKPLIFICIIHAEQSINQPTTCG